MEDGEDSHPRKRQKTIPNGVNGLTSFGEYLPGSILRIRLSNFVTYDAAEFHPGPHLNMIIGPNGTGKSTIVCGICLGLGGKTSLLGRAKEIKEFVKHGKDKAFIEIELKGNSNRNIIIRREISRSNNNTIWKLNGANATEKAVLEKVREMKVQVDNLIQFLPQDRVAEFAQMSSAQVLKETEKATGGVEMYEQHMKLVQLKKEEKTSKTGVEDEKTAIETLERRNAALEPEVVRYRERQKHLEKIDLIKRKRPWLEYDKARADYFEARDLKAQKQEEYEKIQKENAPLLERIATLEKEQKKFDNEKKSLSDEYKTIFKKIEQNEKTILSEENDIDEANKDFDDLKRQVQQRQKKIVACRTEIEQLKEKIQAAPVFDVTPFEREITEINHSLRDFANQINDIQQESKAIRDEGKKFSTEINSCAKKLEQLENMKNQRLQNIRQYNRDVYNGIMWLRENRDRFKEEVFEPAVLSLNVTEQQYAKELETSIPQQTLFAFVCQNLEDHNEIIQELSERQKLGINAITVPQARLEDFRPIPQEKLQRYGFDKTLIDVIDAPNAIKRCLCHYAYVHDIPVTKRQVREEQIIQDEAFVSFFANEYSYKVTRSRYGDRVATTTTRPLKPARNLNVSVDNEKRNAIMREMDMLKDRKAEHERAFNELEAKEKEIRKKDEPLRKRKDELNEKKKQMQNELRVLEKVKVTLGTRETLLENLEREEEEFDMDAQEKKMKQKIISKVKKRATLAIEALKLRSQSTKIQKERVISSLKHIKMNQQISEAKREMEQTNSALVKVKRELDAASASADHKKEAARTKLNEAKKKGELSAEMKEEFQHLPSDLDELNALLAEQEARLSLTSGDSAETVREYENRQIEIENLKARLAKKLNGLDGMQNEITALENEWKPTLLKMIERISGSFSEFMSKLGCVGECKVGEDEDYDNWRLEILVKFRDSEKLHVLTGQRQSGGERAVSTILYLMSLQDMARSPFRIVDEINQGMDPKNERLVHSQIVETATRPNTSQYFLITPKLLADLEYNERMKILCIYNGEWQPEHNEWSVDKFIEKRRALLSQA